MTITYNDLSNSTDYEALRRIYVVHPLDDVPEKKRSPDDLGPLQMTAGVRLSLMALRLYLIVMMVLVGVKAISLAGWF